MEYLTLSLVGFLVALTGFAVVLTQINGKLSRLERQLSLLMEKAGIDPMQLLEASELVKELARDPSRKIHAIKALREETGLGLAEAKKAVEEIARNANP